MKKKLICYKACIQGAFHAEAFLVKSPIYTILAVIIKIENVFSAS